MRLDPRKRLVLVTVHRRDSFGDPLEQICRAIAELHDRHPEVEFLWPVHPNPAVKMLVPCFMAASPRVHLCAPMEYGPFVSAIKRATFVLTDSGGVQEEAPALGRPVLVLRNESERSEAIELGVARLVGHDEKVIVEECSRLLCDHAAYRSMVSHGSPYGDGHAAGRIVASVASFLGASRPERRVENCQDHSTFQPSGGLTACAVALEDSQSLRD